MKIIEDIGYNSIGLEKQKLDLYLPDTDSFPVLVYFHGGGIISGNRKDLRFCPQLAEKGIAVANASYRLYPTAVYPDFIRDAAAAVAWVKKIYPNMENVQEFMLEEFQPVDI